MIDHLLTRRWTEKIDDKWTFPGAVIEFWADVSDRWRSEQTQRNYVKDYELFIFPYLQDKPLEECAREAFDEIIDQLPERKRNQDMVCQEYTIRHFRHLIKRVLDVAEQKGVCGNTLWGTVYALDHVDNEEELAQSEHVKLRKSLSAVEEVRCASELLEDPAQSGEHMGLALMYGAGLRNSEACGVNFGDIRPILEHGEDYTVWVYRTTAVGGNQERFGGKTGNMPRIVPIPQRLLALIQRRRELLMEKVLNGSIPAEGGGVQSLTREQAENRVDGFPIACKGDQYMQRCSASSLTKAGVQLLRKIKVEQQMLALVDRQLQHDGIREKDPTAYLLRRNMGTHLYLLGLSESEIQYIMGHEIESGEKRSYYGNRDMLLSLARKMKLRPVVNEIPEQPVWLAEQPEEEWRFAYDLEMQFGDVRKGDRIRLTIQQVEPRSETEVKILGPAIGEAEQHNCSCPLDSMACILRDYHHLYATAEKRVSAAMERALQALNE